jgi:hypothetical protein
MGTMSVEELDELREKVRAAARTYVPLTRVVQGNQLFKEQRYHVFMSLAFLPHPRGIAFNRVTLRVCVHRKLLNTIPVY